MQEKSELRGYKEQEEPFTVQFIHKGKVKAQANITYITCYARHRCYDDERQRKS